MHRSTGRFGNGPTIHWEVTCLTSACVWNHLEETCRNEMLDETPVADMRLPKVGIGLATV
jgi:hypothetical protein